MPRNAGDYVSAALIRGAASNPEFTVGKNSQTQAHSQANASPVWRRHELGQPDSEDAD